MNEEVAPKKGWGWLQWSVVVIVAFLVIATLISPSGRIPVKSLQMQCASNARQIIGWMQAWAAENNGFYPDHGLEMTSDLTSNEVFHRLFKDGITLNERPFGCPGGRYNPDTHIGEAPDYNQVLMPGENHWGMVGGLKSDSPGHYPLIMENTVDATWPPTWLADAPMKPVKGRAWPKSTILLGGNDGSVTLVELKEKEGRLYLPDKVMRPREGAPLPVMKIVDICATGAVSYVEKPLPNTNRWGRPVEPPSQSDEPLPKLPKGMEDEGKPSKTGPKS